MARPGPLPKNNSTRVNQHSSRQNTVIRVTGEVKAPGASREWHSRMKDWYRALKISGYAALYEPSGWALAAIVAQFLSDELNAPVEERKGARLKVLLRHARCPACDS